MRRRLLVELQNAANCQAPSRRQFADWIAAALGPDREGEVVVRIVSEDESAALNARYRAREGPTNVLAFAADPAAAGLAEPQPPVGDLVICASVVEREAREQGKAPEAHWAHMTVHGALHLVGYDHGDEVQARRMENREREILASLGMSDPYS